MSTDAKRSSLPWSDRLRGQSWAVAMSGWGQFANVLLAGGLAGSILWGYRQRAILRRLENGLAALRAGQTDYRLRRHEEDNESVVHAFDQLAEQMDSRARPTDNANNLEQVLGGICAALRPPLMAMQSYVALMTHQPEELSPTQQLCLRNLRSQTDGLANLLSAPASLSELQKGLSTLKRQISALSVELTGATVLLVAKEGRATAAICSQLSAAGWQAFLAPGADAARIMASAMLPKAILFAVEPSDGFSWRVLVALLQTLNLPDQTYWLAGVDGDGKWLRLLTPEAILLWPPTNDETERVRLWKAAVVGTSVELVGSGPEAGAIAEWLGAHEFKVARRSDAPAESSFAEFYTIIGVPSAAVPVGVERSDSKEASEPDASFAPSILIVPRSLVSNRPEELAFEFAKGTDGAGTADVSDSLFQKLCRRLHRQQNAQTQAPIGMQN